MRYLKRKITGKSRRSNQLLGKSEMEFLLTLIVLLVMATIVDLDISVKQILNIIL